MRWLCFLLASSAAAQARPAKSLQFDLTAIPATRDSFVFFFKGAVRGFAVWQYEIRSLERSQEILFTAASRFEPVEEERLRIVVDRLTGEPISSFHHLELFSPQSDTVMLEHDLEIKNGELTGHRRVGTKDGEVRIVAVSRSFPRGTVWSDYTLFAAAVTNATPGDSLAGRAYSEFGDTLQTLSFVAEPATSVRVPAGQFDVLPLRSGAFRLYTTRTGPRRVVKGETLDGSFAFELAGSGPVVPSQP